MKQFDWRLAMPNARLSGPIVKTSSIFSRFDGDNTVLMPRQCPVAILGFIETNNPQRFRLRINYLNCSNQCTGQRKRSRILVINVNPLPRPRFDSDNISKNASSSFGRASRSQTRPSCSNSSASWGSICIHRFCCKRVQHATRAGRTIDENNPASMLAGHHKLECEIDRRSFKSGPR